MIHLLHHTLCPIMRTWRVSVVWIVVVYTYTGRWSWGYMCLHMRLFLSMWSVCMSVCVCFTGSLTLVLLYLLNLVSVYHVFTPMYVYINTHTHTHPSLFQIPIPSTILGEDEQLGGLWIAAMTRIQADVGLIPGCPCMHNSECVHNYIFVLYRHGVPSHETSQPSDNFQT